jgi:hypothetical protein
MLHACCWLVGCGKRHDARTPDLRKDAVGVAFQFQVACHGLGGAIQTPRADKVRLGSGPNARPDTRVSRSQIDVYNMAKQYNKFEKALRNKMTKIHL